MLLYLECRTSRLSLGMKLRGLVCRYSQPVAADVTDIYSPQSTVLQSAVGGEQSLCQPALSPPRRLFFIQTLLLSHSHPSIHSLSFTIPPSIDLLSDLPVVTC